jgi:predicted HTH transcriptional regulator
MYAFPPLKPRAIDRTIRKVVKIVVKIPPASYPRISVNETSYVDYRHNGHNITSLLKGDIVSIWT